MAGWGSDLGGGPAVCPEMAVLEQDADEGSAVDAHCRLPMGHTGDHHDPALDLVWPQYEAVTP